MMSDPKIRSATPADIAAITAIYGRSVLEETASFETEPPQVAEMHSRWEAIVQAGYPYLVAEIEGEIVGYCYASAYRPRPAYRHTVENTVYVAKPHWRKGLAHLLLRSLMEECRRLGFRQMIGVIGGRDNASSIRLHEGLGFEKVGHIREAGFKHGMWLDVIFMQKTLV